MPIKRKNYVDILGAMGIEFPEKLKQMRGGVGAPQQKNALGF